MIWKPPDNFTPNTSAWCPPLVDLDASQKLGWGVSLWLKCEKADSLCAALEAHGTTITQQPSDGPFGRTFAFIDPDGYLITVHGSKG
ncbi:MAG: VOC family protein [Anaerolineales bacterium]|nr:VOC family protein [Anaerolineales bacterium]